MHTIMKLNKLKWTQKLVMGLAASCGFTLSLASFAAEKPNIIWLISEDNSKHFMHLYSPDGVKMPEVEKLADQGLIFDNAYSNAPVCSTARTTLATGAYGPRIGTHYHRASHFAQLSGQLTPIYQLMKEAGYYVSNNAKTDFNFATEAQLFNQSSRKADWRARKNEQPFFHIQTFYETHESRLHFPKSDIKNKPTVHDPDKVNLFPVYPNTNTFKYTYARYLDNHLKVDTEISKVMAKLEADGELENTFIFFFGDHGGVLPASKGQIYERGLNIPLVVRIPKNFKHLVGKGLQQPNHTRIQGLVSFVDFAPTVAKLAGVKVPAEYDGKAFLAQNIDKNKLNQRATTYAYGDRFDDKYNMVRSVRNGRFKYVRSYTPYYAWGLHSYYRYKQQAYLEWRDLYHAGKLNAVQSAFFEPVQPEQLFDVVADPHETKNLANDPQYQKQLLKLRNQLSEKLVSWVDLSFFPESYLAKYALDDIDGFKKMHQKQMETLLDIANLQMLPYAQTKKPLEQLVQQGNEWEQYWALIVLSRYGKNANKSVNLVKKLLNNSKSVYVKMRAIEFLTRADNFDPREPLLALINTTKGITRLEVLNIAAYLREAYGYRFNVSEQLIAQVNKQKPANRLATGVQFSTNERLHFIKD